MTLTPPPAVSEQRGGMAVSVVIPTYNRAPLVLRAVRSALEATEPDDEIIVVDDGSTDQTEAALAPVRERIRYVRIENGGAGRARNAGIEHAAKPLIAFLDSDDTWMPFKLKLQRAVLARHPELLGCCSNFSVRTPEGDSASYLQNWWSSGSQLSAIFGAGTSFRSPVPLADGRNVCTLHIADLYKAILRDGVVCLITLVYWRDRALPVRFPEDLPTHEDWEFTGRLAQCGPVGYLECDTAVNFGHKGPRLTDANALTCALTRLKAMPRLWGSDPSFLANCGREYAAAWSEQRLRAADWLIRHGRNREARPYLEGVPNAPLSTRVLATLPIPKIAIDLARSAVGAYRRRTLRPPLKHSVESQVDL